MKRKMPTTLVFLSCLYGTGLQASISIQRLHMGRAGGGQYEAIAMPMENGEIDVFTKSCNFKDLTPQEQSSTRFQLAGDLKNAVGSVLNNEATIAETVTLGEQPPAGTWVLFDIDYTESSAPPSEVISVTKVMHVRDPLIVLVDQRSELISDTIEMAQEVAMANSFCKEAAKGN